jgi:predicted RNA-binding protein associated with RNAse of E/G family
MFTVIKLDPQGHEKIRYQGEIVVRDTHSIVISARWTAAEHDLGYTRFESGDLFTEYYYTDRWYNIFDIANSDGMRKGWYCNVTEPAHVYDDHEQSIIEQVDLCLDVWVKPDGQYLVLDEDEFAAATLTPAQRLGAQQGLQTLLTLLEKRQEPFSSLAASS